MNNIHRNNTITIVICTYNRVHILKECLDALLAQTMPHSAYSIIVVDNNSRDSTADMVQNYTLKYNNITYIREHRQSLSIARNTGIHYAQTEWVLFLDDDAKATANYIEVALRVIATNTFSCFGGAILPWRRDPLPPWFLDEYEYTPYHTLTKETALLPTEFVFGGNMAVSKQLASSLGGFDSRYGLQGTTIGYGEDTEFQMRVHAAGHTIGYVPDLMVYHYARPEKYTLQAQCCIRYRAGISKQIMQNSSSITNLFDITSKLVMSPIKGMWISGFRLCRKTFHWQNAVLEVLGRFLFNVGRLTGWLRLCKNCNASVR